MRSIIDVAKSLDLQVVAQGVDDRATWEALKDMGCDLAQGNWLAKPSPANELLQVLPLIETAARYKGRSAARESS